MNRPHHPALVCEGPGEWSVAEWAHRRDQDRILGQDWPFGDGPGHWSVPAPQYHARQEEAPGSYVGMAHPRSTQARRERRERAAGRYAAQAALYAEGTEFYDQAAGRVFRPSRSGATPDLIIVDELSRGPGTRLHWLMELLGDEPWGPEDFRRYYLGEWLT